MKHSRFLKFYFVGQALNVVALLFFLAHFLTGLSWCVIAGFAALGLSLALLFYVKTGGR